MKTIRGELKDALEQPLRRATQPVVFVPTRGAAATVISALHGLDDDARPEQCRVVAPDGTLDDCGWMTRARASDLSERDRLAWRRGEVTEFALAGPAVTATVITSIPTPVVHVDGDGDDDDVFDQFRDCWESAASSEIDALPLSTVRDTLDTHAGHGAARELERSVARTRGQTDIVSVLVWAGTATGASIRAIADTADVLGVASARTVYRRLDRLTDAGLVAAVPNHDGERGRPDRTLQRRVAVRDDEPLPAAVQTALQQ